MIAKLEQPAELRVKSSDPRDLLIRERVMTAFQESGYHRLCQVECRVQGATVELVGQVASFYLKQVAQVLTMRVAQVRGVRNEIRVN